MVRVGVTEAVALVDPPFGEGLTPCTLGRPRVQVAKGSSAQYRLGESVRVRVGRWQAARSARSNESCALAR